MTADWGWLRGPSISVPAADIPLFEEESQKFHVSVNGLYTCDEIVRRKRAWMIGLPDRYPSWKFTEE